MKLVEVEHEVADVTCLVEIGTFHVKVTQGIGLKAEHSNLVSAMVTQRCYVLRDYIGSVEDSPSLVKP